MLGFSVFSTIQGKYLTESHDFYFFGFVFKLPIKPKWSHVSDLSLEGSVSGVKFVRFGLKTKTLDSKYEFVSWRFCVILDSFGEDKCYQEFCQKKKKITKENDRKTGPNGLESHNRQLVDDGINDVNCRRPSCWTSMGWGLFLGFEYNSWAIIQLGSLIVVGSI